MPKLNPGRRARLDQILASARKQSIDENAVVTVIAALDGATQCSWCDCPLLDHSNGRTPDTCQGCPYIATQAVHQYNPGGDYRGHIPICEHHMDDFVDTYHRIGPPAQVVLYDPNHGKRNNDPRRQLTSARRMNHRLIIRLVRPREFDAHCLPCNWTSKRFRRIEQAEKAATIHATETKYETPVSHLGNTPNLSGPNGTLVPQSPDPIE